MLATIKLKSKEVGEKLAEAAEKKIEINEKRELFRPCAARGAVLYFCVVEMTLVNWMYNTSLEQFMGLYDWSIDNSAKAQLIKGCRAEAQDRRTKAQGRRVEAQDREAKAQTLAS